VKLVPSADFSDDHRRELEAGLQLRLGQAMKVETQIVDEIPSEPSGKFRWVICRVPHACTVDWKSRERTNPALSFYYEYFKFIRATAISHRRWLARHRRDERCCLPLQHDAQSCRTSMDPRLDRGGRAAGGPRSGGLFRHQRIRDRVQCPRGCLHSQVSRFVRPQTLDTVGSAVLVRHHAGTRDCCFDLGVLPADTISKYRNDPSALDLCSGSARLSPHPTRLLDSLLRDSILFDVRRPPRRLGNDRVTPLSQIA